MVDIIKVLMIGPGCGGTGGPKHKYFKEKEGFDCEILPLPEPTEGDNEGFEKGILLLQRRLESERPSIILGSSRGAKYVAPLLERKLWDGPVILLSAMGTTRICEADAGNSIFICHGINDRTNPISRVRLDVEYCRTAKLMEFETDHSLHILVQNDILASLVRECIEFKPTNKSQTRNPPSRPKMGALFAQIKNGNK